MNDSPSAAQASPDDAAATTVPATPSKARKGPRRAGAPAGSPKQAVAPAVIVIGDDGTAQAAEAKNDAEAAAGSAAPAPEAEPETGTATERADATVDGDGGSKRPSAAEAADAAATPESNDDTTGSGDTPAAADVAEAAPDTIGSGPDGAVADELAAADHPSTAKADSQADAEPGEQSVDAAAGQESSDAVETDDSVEPVDAVDSLEPVDSVEPDDSVDNLDAAEEAADAAATEPHAPAAAVVLPEETFPAAVEEPAPQSRRALREANSGKIRQVPPARNVAARAATEPARKAAPAPKNVSEPSARKRSRPWAFLRALLFLLVIAALVVAVGTVVSGQEDTGAGPSATEQARESSLAGTTMLLAEATALRHGTNAAAVATAAQAPLDKAITALTAQQYALGDGSTQPPASPTIKPGLTLPAFVTALAANGNAALNNSLTATSAMGRLFASVGTSQLLTARELAGTTGQPLPRSTFLPAGTPGAITQTPAPLPVSSCSSTLEPKEGVSEDQALLAAAIAEQKAVYAYQVSATRFSEPRFSQATTILATHQAALTRLNAELAAKCLPAIDVVPGYELDPAFTASPVTALAALEAQLGVVYGDLAALSLPAQAAPAPAASAGATTAASTPSTVDTGAGLREASVDALVQTALNRLAWEDVIAPLPGLPAADATAPKTAQTPAK